MQPYDPPRRRGVGMSVDDIPEGSWWGELNEAPGDHASLARTWLVGRITMWSVVSLVGTPFGPVVIDVVGQ